MAKKLGQSSKLDGALPVSDPSTHKDGSLEFNEKQWRYMTDAIFGFIGLITLDGRIIEVNLAPLEAAGLTRDDVIGKLFWETHWWAYSSDPDNHLIQAYRSAARGEFARCEAAIRMKDGALTAIDIMFAPLCDEQERIVNIVVFAVDITERKQVEESLRESEERFRAMFEQAAVGVAEIDALSNRFLRVNSRFCEILGYSKQELLALDCMQVSHPEDLAKDLVLRDRLRSGELQEFVVEKRLFRKGGDVVWVNQTVSPLRLPNAPSVHYISTVHDITARVLAEEQTKTLRDELAHVARLATMSEMASGLAHEMNQPLAAIGYYAEGCLDIAANQPGVSSDIVTALGEISRLTDRCFQIVQRLRRMVAKHPARRSTVDVRSITNEVASLLEHSLKAAETPLVIELPEEPVWVSVDAVQIQQVLVNLIRNAIEAQADCPPKARRIDLSVRVTQTNGVEITVADCGKGIPPELANRLFQPFFTTKPAGLGMGLKISQAIVQDHRGSLVFRARPGGGAEFSVRLPQLAKESCQ